MPAPRVVVAFGTRPEAVKMCRLVAQLRDTGRYDVLVVATAQHREMLDQVLDTFGVVPDIDLDLLSHGQTLGELTARTLRRMEGVLAEVSPDLVLVQGDTSTAFAVGLASFYSAALVGHVEAGLRTHDIRRPFPEEMNRRLLSQLTTLHFAPTPRARANLLEEGVQAANVFVTGNTVIDALLWTAEQPAHGVVEPEPGYPLIVVTAHRRESWGQDLESIALALSDIATARPDIRIVFPIHRNPVVRSAIEPILRGHVNVSLIEPLPYIEFTSLLRRAALVLTDSGGLQEEAPSLGVPVLVMREVTERPEAIEFGTARLVGVGRGQIATEVQSLLADDAAYQAMARATNPYGDGRAGQRIVGAIDYHFDFAASPPEPFVVIPPVASPSRNG